MRVLSPHIHSYFLSLSLSVYVFNSILAIQLVIHWAYTGFTVIFLIKFYFILVKFQAESQLCIADTWPDTFYNWIRAIYGSFSPLSRCSMCNMIEQVSPWRACFFFNTNTASCSGDPTCLLHMFSVSSEVAGLYKVAT